MSNKQKEALDFLLQVAKNIQSAWQEEDHSEVANENAEDLAFAIQDYKSSLQEEPGLSELSFADLYDMRSYIVSVHQITSGKPEFVDLHIRINKELHNRIKQLKESGS